MTKFCIILKSVLLFSVLLTFISCKKSDDPQANTSSSSIEDLPSPTTYKLDRLTISGTTYDLLNNKGITANATLQAVNGKNKNSIVIDVTLNNNGTTKTYKLTGIYLVEYFRSIMVFYHPYYEATSTILQGDNIINKGEIFLYAKSTDGLNIDIHGKS